MEKNKDFSGPYEVIELSTSRYHALTSVGEILKEVESIVHDDAELINRAHRCFENQYKHISEKTVRAKPLVCAQKPCIAQVRVLQEKNFCSFPKTIASRK